MTIQELFELRSHETGDCHPDMWRRMGDLKALASQCGVCVEFGVRSGNSTTALLAGGAKVIS